jgi:replicative DNA helicase
MERRIPLINQGAEDNVLAGLINTSGRTLDVGPEVFESLLDVGRDAFTKQTNKIIFEAILRAVAVEESCRLELVHEQLNEVGDATDEVLDHLYDLNGMVINPAQVIASARIIRDMARRRMVSEALRDAQILVESGEKPTDDAIAEASDLVTKAADVGVSEDGAPYGGSKLVMEGLGTVFGITEPGVRIRTGLDDLDEIIGGLKLGALSAVGARSGHGKTTLMSQIARFASVVLGIPTIFFSLEMNRESMTHKAVASECNIPLKHLEENTLTDAELERATAWAARQDDVPYYVSYIPGASASEIHLRAQRAVRELGVQLVIVDYAQAIRSDNDRADDNQRMQEVITTLNEAALKLNVHVMVGSQLKKPPAGQEDSVPQNTDLLNGTKIENAAWLIIMIRRLLGESEEATDHNAELIVTKNRSGRLADVPLKFDGPRQRFLPPSASFSYSGTNNGPVMAK